MTKNELKSKRNVKNIQNKPLNNKELEDLWFEHVGMEPVNFLEETEFPDVGFQEAIEEYIERHDRDFDKEGAERVQLLNNLLTYLKHWARDLNKDIQAEAKIPV